MTAPPALEIRNITARFGGVTALDDVSFTVAPGSITGLIGPNGAGKTTLFNCISGFVPAAPGGRVTIDGVDLLGRPINRIAAAGVARTFQNIALDRAQTARENMMAGCHLILRYGPLSALLPGRAVREAERQAAAAVQSAADMLGLARRDLDAAVGTLSLGVQKKVEVGRAMVRRPRLLLLDEPGGGLDDQETESLLASLQVLRRSLPVTIVLVDHDMDLVMNICDAVCVLNSGRLLMVGTPAEVSASSEVIDVYLGASHAA